MTHAPLTLGTAGHIDHGKSALIRALTGVDTDRLPEEHARGISIELGYARLELPSGRTLSIVDVPGHERYVRTMVAGATGIDLYLMAVAADDGVMPQTREHAAVLRALDVGRGVVAVTKSDLADPELAMLEASELLPEAEVVAVSARSGEGLEDLRAALDRVAAAVTGRADGAGAARLHVDRVFTIKGAGTVVTGTLWSGRISRGDTLELLPGHRRARAREVQVHDRPVGQAAAGQRVAINLTGLAVAEIERGDVVITGGSELRETYLIDAELGFESDGARAREPDSGARVQVHHGTRETPARLAWLGGRFWQLRLEQPLAPARGDRLVVRQIAPPDTLGGGLVLDPHPRKHGPSRALLVRLQQLAQGEPVDDEPSSPASAPGADAVRAAGPAVHPAPGADPAPAEPVPTPAPAPALLSSSARELEDRLRAAGFEPPLDSELDPEDLAALRAAGRAVRVTQSLHYHPDALQEVRARVIAAAGRHGGSITLAQLRDELGTSRKFAQALLEHLDGERITIRRGDEHFLRRRATGPGPAST
jgi:selenocysteine-specific elongation factor